MMPLPSPIPLFPAVLLALAGCQNLNRAMVFSTGTTIGVELSTSPASDTPVQLVFGMKRAEVLIDPVLEGEHADGITPTSHSVIAKLAGRINATQSAGVQGAQWFASGRAAELLAAHPASAAALTDNAEIAASITEAANVTYGPVPVPTVEAKKSRHLADYFNLDALHDAEAIARYDTAAQQAGYRGFAAFILGNPTQADLTRFEQALAE